MKRLILLTFFIVSLLKPPSFADVLPIQPFSTPSGIEVWLVEDHSSPIVSMIASFQKGDVSTPYAPVTALLQAALLAGGGILSPLEMDRFRKGTPAEFFLSLGFSNTNLKIKTTRESLKTVLSLWVKLLQSPDFAKADLDFAKSQAFELLSLFAEDDEKEAYLTLLQGIFPQVTFKPNFKEGIEKISNITIEDLNAEAKSLFLSTRPKIVVVGDITQKDLLKLLEETMGALPLPVKTPTKSVFEPQWAAKEEVIKKVVPQAMVAFGQPGICPLNKDYPKYLLLEYVIQGRLFDELRDKRGLIYGIQEFSMHLPQTDVLLGDFSCECGNAQKIAKFIRSEWERLKDFGITERELTSAKLTFKRAQILSLTSTSAVAHEYIDSLIFNLGPQAAKNHLEETEKVTLEEMNNFVQNFLKPELLSFVLIGPTDKKPSEKDVKDADSKS
ncbi:MAG: insulinase family protein [Alphaproteobacteria bacterium]|nr:insulinase family protein [Alphaproteobacteria bacterium]